MTPGAAISNPVILSCNVRYSLLACLDRAKSLSEAHFSLFHQLKNKVSELALVPSGWCN